MTEEAPSIDQVVSEAQLPAEPAPEPTPEPVAVSPEPITADDVKSDKAPEEHLPDSSLVAQRLQQRVDRSKAIDEYRKRDEDYAKMKKELELLRTLRGEDFTAQYNETTKQIESRDDDQSQLMRELRGELKSIRDERDRFKSEIEQQEEARAFREAQNDVVQYVKEQSGTAPLLNEIGQQQLVFQKMINEQQRTGRYMSEAQAMSEVEGELRDIVERCAPLLGYTKSEVEQKREEQVSVGAGNLSMADPLDYGSMSEDDAINALVSQYEKAQR